MNNEEMLVNYLSLIKSNVEVYIHGTLESSNESVTKVLRSSLTSTIDSQRNIFDELVNCNFYKVSNIKSSDIKKAYDNFIKNV